MHRKIKLYSLSTCPACKKTKEFLNNHKVEYENIEVDTLDSGEQWVVLKELKKVNPDQTFPTIVVEKSLIGFDEEKLKKLLEI